MAGTANKHDRMLRRPVALLGSAALTLTLVAVTGPARAATVSPAPRATVFQPGTPEPPPAVPSPLDTSGPAQVQALAQKFEDDVKADQQKADQLQSEKGTLEQRAGDIQSREDALSSQAANLKSQGDSLETQAQALDEQITAHNNAPHVFQLPDEEAAYLAYNAEKERLDAQKAALQTQLDALNGQITKIQGDQNKVQADETQLETDVQKHNDAVEALGQDVSRLADERQEVLARIADLMQSLSEAQNGEVAAPGGDAVEPPPALAAPAPQSEGAASGGDQAAPPAAAYAPVGSGSSISPGGSASGSSPAASAPAPIVDPTPVQVTLAPATVKSLPPKQTENLNPTQTFSGLIPEGNGNYAAAQVQPPPGQSLPPGQQAFDDAINNGGKATTVIGGKPATIDRVVPVASAPSADRGGDVARPARATQRPQPRWIPGSNEPVTQYFPKESLSDLRSALNDQGTGDLADKYDFEFTPVIIDAQGRPLFGSAPTDSAGNPLRGATGKPVFQFSNLGLQNQDQAIRTFTGDLVEADLELTGAPTFKEYGYLTGPQQTSKNGVGFRYQKLVTGQKYEEHWILDGELIKVDGGPGANGYIYEAKWTGNGNEKNKKPYYSLDNAQWDKTKAVDQAARLLALNRALGGPGVRYAISSPQGVAGFTELFELYFSEQIKSGELQIEYVPATGMK